MVKIKFKHNKYGDKYYGAVVFTRYGEVQKVEEDIARKLLLDHPDKFELVSGEIDIEDVSVDTVLLEFVHNKFLEEYHGDVDFYAIGEVQEVEKSVAEYLLEVHGDKFIEVVEKLIEPETTIEDKILSVVSGSMSVTEIADKLSVRYQDILPPIGELLESRRLRKTMKGNKKIYSRYEEEE